MALDSPRRANYPAPPDNKSSRTFLSKYEVAEPESYDCYVLDPSQQTPAPASTDKIKSPSVDLAPPPPGTPNRWDDPLNETPKVKAADASKFEPPDPTTPKSWIAPVVTREKRAVWIVHGMGQQIPFETVDSLTRGILDAAQPQQIKPRLRTVKIGAEVVQRVELDIDGKADANGHSQHYELHLYESYWAPITEGVAKLSDVAGFLWDGGSRGMLNWVKSFKRAMFGGMAKFSIRSLTPIWLSAALLLLTALTVINGIILLAAGAKSGIVSLKPFTAHWCELSALASCMIAVASTFGAVLFIADMCKPQQLSRTAHVLIGSVGWVSLFVTFCEILKAALLMAITTHLDWRQTATCATSGCHSAPMASPGFIARIHAQAVHLIAILPSQQMQGFATLLILGAIALVALAMFTRAILRSSETQLAGNWCLIILGLAAFALNMMASIGSIWVWAGHPHRAVLTGWWCLFQSPVWVWPFLILFSAQVRSIMVQYVGDVAIYIQPNKLDRFNEVRDKIKTAARTVASAVFTAYRPHSDKEFLYPHVVVVGHSLGSVIVYDTLNRLMLDDWLAKNALQIAERTKAMITFGSPLNKTAFLFTIQGSDTLHVRERLASTVQPLITSYRKFRKLTWINVYSRNDIISGKLKFYDLPGFQDAPVPPEAVQNIIDKDASVPLVAHNSYWSNKTVWEQLLAQIAP